MNEEQCPETPETHQEFPSNQLVDEPETMLEPSFYQQADEPESIQELSEDLSYQGVNRQVSPLFISPPTSLVPTNNIEKGKIFFTLKFLSSSELFDTVDLILKYVIILRTCIRGRDIVITPLVRVCVCLTDCLSVCLHLIAS